MVGIRTVGLKSCFGWIARSRARDLKSWVEVGQD